MDEGRIRHYGEFYGLGPPESSPPSRLPDDRPLWLIVGNCQAEALRQALDTVGDAPFRTVRMPPVHELETADLAHLDRLLRQASVLLAQPIRDDYRDLPIGTAQLATALPSAATTVRWPVIRYAGLYPFQVIVRHPADRSLGPAMVPYHDLRTVAAALAGRSASDPWDVEVAPSQIRAVADESTAALVSRERRDTDVGVADVLASAGADAAHAINHPGNTVIAALADRVLAELGVDRHVELGASALLGSVMVPLEQRVLDARGIDAPARPTWWFHGESIDPDRVHRAQMQWYHDHPDFVRLAVERHRSTIELLGLPVGPFRA